MTPVVAPVKRIRSRAAIAWPKARAVSAIAGVAASSADPMTPILIFISPPLNTASLDFEVFCLHGRRDLLRRHCGRKLFFAVPPFLRQEPNEARHQKEGPHRGRDGARR